MTPTTTIMDFFCMAIRRHLCIERCIYVVESAPLAGRFRACRMADSSLRFCKRSAQLPVIHDATTDVHVVF
jgi:hypothetical protein